MDDVREVEHDRAVAENVEDEDWKSHAYYNLNLLASNNGKFYKHQLQEEIQKIKNQKIKKSNFYVG